MRRREDRDRDPQGEGARKSERQIKERTVLPTLPCPRRARERERERERARGRTREGRGKERFIHLVLAQGTNPCFPWGRKRRKDLPCVSPSLSLSLSLSLSFSSPFPSPSLYSLLAFSLILAPSPSPLLSSGKEEMDVSLSLFLGVLWQQGGDGWKGEREREPTRGR